MQIRFFATVLAVAVGGLLIYSQFGGGPKAKRELDPRQRACLEPVIDSYLKTSLEIPDHPEEVEEIIVKRRLQEQYCMQAAQCFAAGQTDEMLATQIRNTKFSSCLRREVRNEVNEYDLEHGSWYSDILRFFQRIRDL